MRTDLRSALHVLSMAADGPSRRAVLASRRQRVQDDSTGGLDESGHSADRQCREAKMVVVAPAVILEQRVIGVAPEMAVVERRKAL